jgi:uncharacterized membrane protein YfcA
MNIDPLLILGVATVIFLGGVMQSAIGFAYSLFATPIMVWMGIPLPTTIAIVSTCSLVQNGLGSWHLRADVPWREAWLAIAVRLPAVVIGVLMLRRLAFLDPGEVKLVVGCIICLLVGIQVVFRVKPAERVHGVWTALAFLTSGLLSGITGMGGPPLVMWVMAHNWSSEKTRSFLFAVFLVSAPIQIALLYLAFGPDILKGVLAGALLTPAVFLGSKVGIPLGNRMPKAVLRNMAYLVLVIIGLSSIFQQVFRLFR